MKFLYILLGLLLTVAVSSANITSCGPHSCLAGQTCRQIDNVCNCIPVADCHEVTLTTNVIGTWQDGSRGGKTYTQYNVVIQNNLNRNIKNLYIGTDYTQRLRTPVNQNIWNVQLLSNGVLTLPAVQPSINAHASYTFGFIVEGSPSQVPHSVVLSVVF